MRYPLLLGALPLLAQVTFAQIIPPGEGPALGPRVHQSELAGGILDLPAVRASGMRIFTTRFNKFDGFGDGPMNPLDPFTPGGRPTLNGNGTFLRVNGLDSQTCLECHAFDSTTTNPPRLGIGGVGLINSSAMAMSQIDVTDESGLGQASFTGRLINPPFLFGSGGVQLIGREMTAELQQLKQHALDNDGVRVPLIVKGIDFGVIISQGGVLNTSRVVGVDADLVVRPFGRKGEFFSTRDFDVGAMQFHFGIQAVDLVGANIDADGDGVVNEILPGELSVLQIFNTTLKPPVTDDQDAAAMLGESLFGSIGCAECHTPALESDGHFLTYSFPEVADDPSANVFYQLDLRRPPTSFPHLPAGGISVPMFSDLKRHDMGPDLAESAGSVLDPLFITPRLWGIADTAPYLHDGRALTLTAAIVAHGGEGTVARQAFTALADSDKIALLSFLRTLRTPTDPLAGIPGF